MSLEIIGLSAAEVALLGRLGLSLLLGAGIGLEREMSNKPAGLRTNMLICAGAELFTEASLFAATVLAGQEVMGEIIRADPARIAAQIVSGIGFIGAGTILVMRGTIRGLTTAATLWVVAAIGMTVGLRLYAAAIGASALVLVTLALLGKLERTVFEEQIRAKLRIVVAGALPSAPRADELSAGAGPSGPSIDDLIVEADIKARHGGFERGDDSYTLTYYITGPQPGQDALVRRLSELDSVRSVRIDR